MALNLLVADSFSKKYLDALDGFVNVRYEPSLKAEDLRLALKGVHLLVVRSTQVTREAIEAADSLTLILRAGAGVNTIDVKAASERGIFVSNCPGKNAVAVAELVFGLMLAIDRHIPDNVAELRQGRWNKSAFSKASGLLGRTLGIVGLGAIGLEVATRAKAFGMNVFAWSRSLTPEKAKAFQVEYVPTLLELASKSDVVTLHLPLSPETKNLIHRDFFQAMKPGAIFINTARSEIVNYQALMEAVREKKIRVGLDVFPNEPGSGVGEYHHPILELPDVYGTHHIGASTEQAQEAIAEEAVRIIEKFVRTGIADNCVNLSKNTPATHQLMVRHLDRVGVLASILDLLRKQGINVEEMENTIFEGSQAACCRIQLSSKPSELTLEEIKNMEAVFHVELIPIS
jgi:D-3-phosphoglycerate dehydrogenase